MCISLDSDCRVRNVHRFHAMAVVRLCECLIPGIGGAVCVRGLSNA